MAQMISFYNEEVERYERAAYNGKTIDFVDKDPTKVKWTREVLADLEKGRKRQFDKGCLIQSAYRPFSRQWAYYNRHFNNCVYQMPRIFPNAALENKVIAISGIGNRSGFSALMVNAIPNHDSVEKGQCFPLKLYEGNTVSTGDDLFASQDTQTGYTIRDGLTDAGLAHFRTAYPNETISKEDIFYYIYGLLHAEDYRCKYADNLSKQLPRIPHVKTASNFWAFAEAGRALGDLHVNYESAVPYPVTLDGKPTEEAHYYVIKMKFGKAGKDKDKASIVYNEHITLNDVPLEAYDYIVNGKPAIEWVMERQCVKTDKASGIVNDSNLYATETMGDATYPLKLLQRVITVSLETMKIVNALPKLDIQEHVDKKPKVA